MLSRLKEKYIVTVEDNVLAGGLGSLINSYFAGGGKVIRNFAYGDEFIPHGGVAELMAERGLSYEAITEYIKNEIR